MESMTRIPARLATLAFLLALAFLSLPGAAGAGTQEEAPANDASFWLEVDIEGWSTPMDELPAGIGNEGAEGVAVYQGTVVTQSSEELGLTGADCTYASKGNTCDVYKTVTGSYADGYIEITYRRDRTVTFDGTSDNTPVEPGSVEEYTEFKLTGQWLAEGSFEGDATITEVYVDWDCARWQDFNDDGVIDDYDVNGACALERYVPGAPKSETVLWHAWVRGDYTGGPGEGAPAGGSTADEEATPEPLTLTVLGLTGDVEYIPAGSDEPQPLTAGTVLQEGDTISTGFESGGRFRVGQSELTVPQMTSLRIDELLREENIEKTQLFLLVGAIKANVRHTDSIRSDFSVTTPTSNSSVRGTEFVVSTSEDGASTTYVLDGTVSVEDAAGTAMDVTAGNKAFVAPEAAVAGPEPYDASELPVFPEGLGASGSAFDPALLGIALAVVAALGGVALLMRRRRRPAQAPTG